MKRIELAIHPDARINGDRAKILPAVLAVYERNGMLTPSRLIEAARPVNSPLHAEFTWDAKQALEEVQRSQALYLIRVISLEIREVGTDEVYRGREFIMNPVDNDGGYISVRSALSSREMREQTLAALLSRLESLQQELRAFKEFSEVVQAIDFVKRKRKKAA